MAKIEFNLNGQKVEFDTDLNRRLVDFLRQDHHLVGTKEGCGEGECGACSVLINGRLHLSCLTILGTLRCRAIDVELEVVCALELARFEGEKPDAHSVRTLIVVALLGGLDHLEGADFPIGFFDLGLQRVHTGSFQPELGPVT